MNSLFLIVLLGLYPMPVPGNETLAVIINVKNPISNLNVGEVRSYWMCRPKKRWEALDKPIKPADRSNKCIAKDIFYSRLIKMSDAMIETYFHFRQYQTGESPPVKFRSDEEVIDYVSNEDGAIGYVIASSLDSKALEKVKVVLYID